MKTLKKSLIALLIVAVALSLAAVIAVAVSPSGTGSLEALDALIAEVQSASTAKEKTQKLSAVSSYLSEHTFADDEIDIAHERFEKVCEEVSDFTVKEIETRLDVIVQLTSAREARIRLESVRDLLNGEGYIDTSNGAIARLSDDVTTVDYCIDLTYIGLDGVDLKERGEVLLSFFKKIETAPIPENSKYYDLCVQKRDAVVDKTIGLLYEELGKFLVVAEDAEKTDDERMAAVASFRELCETCYFDTAREEYIALTDRCAIAEGRVYLGKIARTEDVYEKGVLLQESCKALAAAGILNDGAEDSDKTNFFKTHEAEKTAIADALYAKTNELLVTAVAEGTENRAEYLAEYDQYLANCYFAETDARLEALKANKNAADALLLLYAVIDAGRDTADGGVAIIAQDKALKILVVFLDEHTLDTTKDLGQQFNDQYSGEDGAYEQVVDAFYKHLETLTTAIGNAETDFEAARLAKDTILSLGEDGYFEPLTAPRHVKYLADLSAAERNFGSFAIDWAIHEFEEAMKLEDADAKKTRIEEIAAAFESYQIEKYEDAKTEEEIEFNNKYDNYTKASFYAVLDVLADAAIAAHAAGVKDLGEYFTAINEHLATYSYDKVNDAEWAAYENKTEGVRKAYGAYLIGEVNNMCDAADALTGADLLAAYNRLNAYYRSHDFYEDQSYFDFLDRLQTLSERAAEALVEVKAKLEAEVPLAEYADTSENLNTFEGGKATGVNASTKNRVFVDERNGGYNSDKCMTIEYGESKDTYYGWGVSAAASNHVVIEFDITTFDEMPPSLRFSTGANSATKGRVYPYFFFLSTAGGKTDLYTKQGGKLLKSDIIQKGVWTHIAMTYDPMTKMLQMYVNYEKAGDPYQESQTGCTDWVLSEGFRLGSSGNERGSVSFDNLRSYKGTVPRTVNRFQVMSSDDKFLLFGNLLEQYHNDPTSVSIADVDYAYTQMGPLLSVYWSASGESYITEDEDLRHMVDVYLKTEKENIKKQMNNIAFADLKKLYDSLVALGGDIDAIESRENLITQIDDYVKNKADSLDTTTAEYKALMESVEEARANLTIDMRVKEFRDAITRFKRAPSLAAMSRHYESCKAAYGDGFDEETLARFRDLPALIEEYKGFSADIDVKVKEANAKSIVECMRHVASFDESDYEEKYEEINKYILIVRSLVTPNEDGTLKYKTGYLGVAAAVRLYHSVNDFFYQKLQLEHIEKLSTVLNKYTTLDSYIEKMGVCIYIRNYVATNDVDETNPEIRRIIESCAVYEVELGMKDGVADPTLPNYQLEKYEKLIEQNTKYFVDTVGRMAFLEGYAELKATYDDIMKIYYYMNIDSDEVQAAIKEFAKYESILREMEAHGDLFIKAMEEYAAAETATDKYKALSKAYAELALGANEHYDGISDAMALYRTAAEAYNAKADTVNEELSSAMSVMCTARADVDGVKYVIAAFKKRYE